MTNPRPKKMTPAQRAALENIRDGRPASLGLRGQAAHGGLNTTLWSLQRRGWTEWRDDERVITEEGRRALEG